MGEGVGAGVGDGDGVGEAVGDGEGDAEASTEGLGSMEANADAAAVGSADASTNGVSLGGGSRAIAVEVGVVPAAGSSMPPRWTTKPNEIPADSTSTRIAASVARGTAEPLAAASGSWSAIDPRR